MAQGTSTTIFVPKFPKLAQISPNLPKNNKLQTWRQKNAFIVILGAIFVK